MNNLVNRLPVKPGWYWRRMVGKDHTFDDIILVRMVNEINSSYPEQQVLNREWQRLILNGYVPGGKSYFSEEPLENPQIVREQ